MNGKSPLWLDICVQICIYIQDLSGIKIKRRFSIIYENGFIHIKQISVFKELRSLNFETFKTSAIVFIREIFDFLIGQYERKYDWMRQFFIANGYQRLVFNRICYISLLNVIIHGSSWPWSYDSWSYNYMCNQYLSPLKWRVYVIKFVSDLRQVGGFLH